MAKPSDKSEEMERSMQGMFGFDRRVNIKNDMCCPKPIGCGGPATEFDGDLSRKEYTISGLCQECQNSVFGKQEE
jgi:hypothetical protein